MRPGGPTVTPSGDALGARITGLDLARPLGDAAFGVVLRALAAHGVVCFPGQELSPAAQAAFSRRFGELEVHVSGAFQVPGQPEVMILSNMVEERAADRAGRCRAGLAHRHELQPHYRFRERAVRAEGASAGRARAGRYRILRHGGGI